MTESAKWYVIHTYSGYENAVKTSIEKFVTGRNMEDMILRIEIPLETVTEITDSGASKDVERKVFPGYVLIKMVMSSTPGNFSSTKLLWTWLAVGVTGVLSLPRKKVLKPVR